MRNMNFQETKSIKCYYISEIPIKSFQVSKRTKTYRYYFVIYNCHNKKILVARENRIEVTEKNS